MTPVTSTGMMLAGTCASASFIHAVFFLLLGFLVIIVSNQVDASDSSEAVTPVVVSVYLELMHTLLLF